MEHGVKMMLEAPWVTIKLEADESWMCLRVCCIEPYKYQRFHKHQRERSLDSAALQQRRRGNKVDLFYNNKGENNYCKFNYISNATSDKNGKPRKFLYLCSVPGWTMRQETITLWVLKWPGVQSWRVPRKRKSTAFLKSQWAGRSLFVIHIEIKDSLKFINERWATNELKFCMCCDLFPQYVWVCIFVCCVFTSFRPGEGAELAKPPLLISLRSRASP